jgi:hypothetical protein
MPVFLCLVEKTPLTFRFRVANAVESRCDADDESADLLSGTSWKISSVNVKEILEERDVRGKTGQGLLST